MAIFRVGVASRVIVGALDEQLTAEGRAVIMMMNSNNCSA
jgi:hypothetical protein